MIKDPPDIPIEELRRVARLHSAHPIEVHREFDDGDPTYAVEVFGLPEESWRSECDRLSDAIVDYCQDHGWLATFYVLPALEGSCSLAQG